MTASAWSIMSTTTIFMQLQILYLTPCRLECLQRFNCKQWRPRWNVAWCGISSGSEMFAKTKSIFSEGNTVLFCILWSLKIYNEPSCLPNIMRSPLFYKGITRILLHARTSIDDSKYFITYVRWTLLSYQLLWRYQTLYRAMEVLLTLDASMPIFQEYLMTARVG